jgi:hypothetical protein
VAWRILGQWTEDDCEQKRLGFPVRRFPIYLYFFHRRWL